MKRLLSLWGVGLRHKPPDSKGVASLFQLIMAQARCGARYRVAGESFSSPSEALKKQADIMSHALDKITPSNHPVHGTTLVIFPSAGELQKNYMRFTNPGLLHQEQIYFVITGTNNYFQYLVDVIKKRGIFDAVSVA